MVAITTSQPALFSLQDKARLLAAAAQPSQPVKKGRLEPKAAAGSDARIQSQALKVFKDIAAVLCVVVTGAALLLSAPNVIITATVLTGIISLVVIQRLWERSINKNRQDIAEENDRTDIINDELQRWSRDFELDAAELDEELPTVGLADDVDDPAADDLQQRIIQSLKAAFKRLGGAAAGCDGDGLDLDDEEESVRQGDGGAAGEELPSRLASSIMLELEGELPTQEKCIQYVQQFMREIHEELEGRLRQKVESTEEVGRDVKRGVKALKAMSLVDKVFEKTGSLVKALGGSFKNFSDLASSLSFSKDFLDIFDKCLRYYRVKLRDREIEILEQEKTILQKERTLLQDKLGAVDDKVSHSDAFVLKLRYIAVQQILRELDSKIGTIGRKNKEKYRNILEDLLEWAFDSFSDMLQLAKDFPLVKTMPDGGQAFGMVADNFAFGTALFDLGMSTRKIYKAGVKLREARHNIDIAQRIEAYTQPDNVDHTYLNYILKMKADAMEKASTKRIVDIAEKAVKVITALFAVLASSKVVLLMAGVVIGGALSTGLTVAAGIFVLLGLSFAVYKLARDLYHYRHDLLHTWPTMQLNHARRQVVEERNVSFTELEREGEKLNDLKGVLAMQQQELANFLGEDGQVSSALTDLLSDDERDAVETLLQNVTVTIDALDEQKEKMRDCMGRVYSLNLRWQDFMRQQDELDTKLRFTKLAQKFHKLDAAMLRTYNKIFEEALADDHHYAILAANLREIGMTVDKKLTVKDIFTFVTSRHWQLPDGEETFFGRLQAHNQLMADALTALGGELDGEPLLYGSMDDDYDDDIRDDLLLADGVAAEEEELASAIGA